MGEMQNTGIGLGDAMIMARQGWNNEGYNGMWNNPFFYLIFLALFGNGGIGGIGGNASSDIKSAIYASNDQQTLMDQIRGISYGLADLGYALNNGIKDGTAQTINAVNNGFNSVNMALTESRFADMQNTNAIQQAIANTNHNIDNLRFNEEQNTCKITTAMHAEGEATRALIAQNAVQDLRDKLAYTSQELQNAKFALSQQAQNAYLIEKLTPPVTP